MCGSTVEFVRSRMGRALSVCPAVRDRDRLRSEVVEQKMRAKIITVLLLACACLSHSAWAGTNFVAGADFSLLSFFESQGVHYRENGVAKDGLQILKNHGINCVRLRLFTSSAAQAAADPYNYINNTNYTVPLAVRVKSAGLQFCLDFHYSDTWADPGHQATPAAWTNLGLAALVQQVRSYSSNTVATFAAAGAMPEYVQVGNEITSGFLWPLGKVFGTGGTPWSQFGQLMKGAIQGIQDASGTAMPKVIVHIDRGGDWPTTMWFFDNLNAQGVPYDIIGESYYTFYQGSPASLSNCLNNAAAQYGKPIMIAEDAFPWSSACPTNWTNSLYGYPPSPAGQVSFMSMVAQTVKSLPNNLGAGFFYWGTEYQAVSGVPEAGYDTASFFDASGNVLPVADAVGGMAAPLLLKAARAGPNVRLQWPFSGAGSKLMTATSAAPAAVWTFVSDSRQTTDTVFSAAVPMSNRAAIFRLQSN